MTEWTKDKEKKVLWKYRFHLTVRVIRIVLLLLLLYGVYSILLSIGYSKTDLDRKIAFQTNLAIDWTQSGLHGEYNMIPSDITPFLSQQLEIPIYRTIGKEKQTIGNMEVTKRILTSLSHKETSYFQPSDNMRFTFNLPEDPRTGKKLMQSDYSDQLEWKSLDMVHEGTVADLAFSTDRYFKPEELLQVLEKYDLDVLWMPLYSGELKGFESGASMSSGNNGTYLSVDSIGMSRAIDIDDDYMSSTIVMLDSSTIEENKEIMLKNMESLINNESKTYLENFLGLWYLEERYNYLKENELQVYGAVVTGPVKELLKLKNEPEFRSIQVGEFEYWNWRSE